MLLGHLDDGGWLVFWQKHLALVKLDWDVVLIGKLAESVKGGKYFGGVACQAEVIKNRNDKHSRVAVADLRKHLQKWRRHTQANQKHP